MGSSPLVGVPGVLARVSLGKLLSSSGNCCLWKTLPSVTQTTLKIFAVTAQKNCPAKLIFMFSTAGPMKQGLHPQK